MKKISFAFISMMVLLGLSSCEFDNYDEPNMMMKGTLEYNGTQINVKNNQITFHLYEDGWELSASTYMDVYVAQDGSFSAAVYKGKDYRLVRLNNNGPWLNPSDDDVITLSNYHGKTVKVEVTPYFLFEKTEISCSNKVIKGDFSIKKITDGASIEKVGLYVSRNVIVDNAFSALGNVEVSGVESGSISVDLNGIETNSIAASIPKTGFVYARLGFKVVGFNELIYSEPVKVSL